MIFNLILTLILTLSYPYFYPFSTPDPDPNPNPNTYPNPNPNPNSVGLVNLFWIPTSEWQKLHWSLKNFWTTEKFLLKSLSGTHSNIHIAHAWAAPFVVQVCA